MKYYNESVKNRYLESIKNEGSRTTISYIFMASRSAEENVLGKDLYNFSLQEIEEVMKNLTANTIHTAKGNMGHIKSYISWSIKNGYRDNNINPLDAVGEDWYSRFVDRSKKIHWSEEEFYDLVEKLDSAQNQAFLSLIFEGILGKGTSEIRLLHYNDVKWNENKITVTEEFEGEKEVREDLVVSDRTMRYLANAYKEQTYRTYNSETGDYNERDLLESDYIIKNVKSPRARAGVPVNQSVLYSRLNEIKEKYNLDYLTPNSIRQSGMVKMLIDLYNRDGKIEYEQFAEIGKRFKFSMMYNNGYSYYNTTLMREFLNPSKVKELYDIDIQF